MSFDARVLTGISVLTAVTDAGSFAGAAEALDMTPSGVSRAVARLETRLGVRLFDRNPRSVALTEEGRRFHAQVLPLLTSLEEAATGVMRRVDGGERPPAHQCRSVVFSHGTGAALA